METSANFPLSAAQHCLFLQLSKRFGGGSTSPTYCKGSLWPCRRRLSCYFCCRLNSHRGDGGTTCQQHGQLKSIWVLLTHENHEPPSFHFAAVRGRRGPDRAPSTRAP